MEKNPNSKVNMIDNKTIKCFTDIISGAMGSLAIAYITPMISSPDDDALQTARNGLIMGSVFSIAKNITHNTITKGYNYIKGRNVQENDDIEMSFV